MFDHLNLRKNFIAGIKKVYYFIPAMRISYTLIELLVAISAIVILLSLLMPSLETAHEASLTSECASNLRQVGLGITRVFLDKKFPKPLNPFWKDDDLAKSQRIAPSYIHYAHLPPPKVPPEVPSSEESNSSSMPAKKTSNMDVEDMLNLFSLGCPKVEINPSYEFDPINEPEFRSYSFLEYNENKSYGNSWAWLLSESSSATIEGKFQLSDQRHSQKVNLYFKDGHIELLEIKNVSFPE